MSYFLVPALAAAGPSAGQIFTALQRRKRMTVLFASGLLTVLSGLRLLWIVSAGFDGAYLATPSGRGFAAAGAAAVLAMLVGLLINRPTQVRVVHVSTALSTAPAEQRGALAQELAALRRRGAIASSTASLLLVLAASGMAVARYLR
jgi:hypothetical protein